MEKEILENKMSKLEKELLFNFLESNKIGLEYFSDKESEEKKQNYDEHKKVFDIIDYNGANDGGVFFANFKSRYYVVLLMENEKTIRVRILRKSNNYSRMCDWYKFIEGVEIHRMGGKSHLSAFLTVLRIEIKNRMSTFINKRYAIIKGQFEIYGNAKCYYIDRKGGGREILFIKAL